MNTAGLAYPEFRKGISWKREVCSQCILPVPTCGAETWKNSKEAREEIKDCVTSDRTRNGRCNLKNRADICIN